MTNITGIQTLSAHDRGCTTAASVMAVWWLADMRPKYDAEQACLDAAMGKQDVPRHGRRQPAWLVHDFWSQATVFPAN
jgi:hypothetical protein